MALSLSTYGLIGVTLAATAVVGCQEIKLAAANLATANEKTAHEKTRTDWTTQREAMQKEALAAKIGYEKELQDQLAAQQESARVFQSELARLQKVVVPADTDSRVKLWRDYADATARRCREASSPTALAASTPTGPSADLLADVPRRIDEAASTIARFAHESRIAGLKCVSDYNSSLK